MVKIAGDPETTITNVEVVGDGEAMPEEAKQSELGMVLDYLKRLENRLDAVERKEDKPLARPLGVEDRIKALKPKKGEGAVTSTDVFDLRSRGAGFAEGDVVKMGKETWLHTMVEKKGLMPEGGELLGVITKVGPLTGKRLEHKYTVRFPGIGKDGCYESELELVERA